MTMTAFRVDPEAEETAPPNEDDEELGSVEKQKSVIMHVLSQIKQGKELAEVGTRFVQSVGWNALLSLIYCATTLF